jgi:valyl-tRNA synthetase
LYNEFWHTFCDEFLESSKSYLYATKDKETDEVISEPEPNEKKETQLLLLLALKSYLKMLHPFIPFITERIWQEMPKEEGDHESLLYTMW